VSDFALPGRPVAGALMEAWLERRETPLLESPFAFKISRFQDAWTWEFWGLNAGLELCLRECIEAEWSIELFVRARLEGRVWGLLYYSRLDPVRVGDRWESLATGDLDPDAVRIEPAAHPHRLIERELFAPFALWVEEVLVDAEWVLFYGGAHPGAVQLFPNGAPLPRDDLIDAVRLRGAEDSTAPLPTLLQRLARRRLRLKHP